MSESTPPPRVSQSFSEEEVTWLHQLFSTLIRGGDGSVLVRRKVFQSIHRKAFAMKKRIEKQRAEKIDNAQPVTETKNEAACEKR